jgi:hypothetical protein
METTHPLFATQDWSLIRHRTLTIEAAQARTIEAVKGELWVTVAGNCGDYFVRAGESLDIPCRDGAVVIESTSSTSIVRVTLAAQSPLIANVGPTLGQALSVSLLRPLASLALLVSNHLRSLARWLAPSVAQ